LTDQSKSRTIVEIYGKTYTIIGQESPEHIKEVADYVDQIMREFSSRNPSLDSTNLAVLAAINAASEYLKLKKKLEQ